LRAAGRGAGARFAPGIRFIKKMEINPVGHEDVAILLSLMRAMQEDDPWSVPFEEDRVRTAVENLLANPGFGRAWLVREDGRIVGYAVMSFDYSLEYGGRNAWVDEIFIAKEARGKGLGERVMDFVERAAREAGVTAIHLEVNPGNKAIDLYRRRGFEEHDRYLMTKWLG
jgi:diamine N-acetyltransferase